MSAIRMARPGKRNRAMAHAAASPKLRLAATAAAATARVSRTACRVSGSRASTLQKPGTPSANAWTTTLARGTKTKSDRYPTPTAMSPQRTRSGSRRAGPVGSRIAAAAPAFQEVDGEEGAEGEHQQHGADRGGLPVRKLLQTRDDQHRRDLGPVRQVAGDEHDRAVLAEGPGEGEREARDPGRPEVRERDPPERLSARRPQAGRGLLHGRVRALEHRLDRADDER